MIRVRLVAALALGLSSAGSFAHPLAESPGSSIGYPSAAAALQALRARADVRIHVENGWTIADDAANATLWTFAPDGHPAYPAAVKRETKQRDGSVYIDMNVLCGATKAACDQLIRDFQKLNDGIRDNFKHSH